MARKYPVPKPVKFDEKRIEEKIVYGTTTFGLSDRGVMMYHTLTKSWSTLYDKKYNDVEARWKQVCTLSKT